MLPPMMDFHVGKIVLVFQPMLGMPVQANQKDDKCEECQIPKENRVAVIPPMYNFSGSPHGPARTAYF